MAEDQGHSVATDSEGNVVVAGVLASGSVACSMDSARLSGGSFLARFGPDGALHWSKPLGASSVTGPRVAVDRQGAIFVTGRASNGTDLGQGALAGPIMLAKYSPAGAIQWSVGFGNFTKVDRGSAIAVDSDGNVILGGPCNFGDSPSFPGMNGSCNGLFLARFTTGGSYVKHREFLGNAAGAADVMPYSIAVDSQKNIVMTGIPNDAALNGGTAISGSGILFLAKYDVQLNHSWSFRFGASAGNSVANSLAVDPKGDIYVTGFLTGRGTLDKTAAVFGSTDARRIFMTKYSGADGAMLWPQPKLLGEGLQNSVGYAVDVDSSGNPVFAGHMAGSIDFGGERLSSSDLGDIYLAKYTPEGDLRWARRYGGSGLDLVQAISVDRARSRISLVGQSTSDALKFDGMTPLSNGGLNDFFLFQVGPAPK